MTESFVRERKIMENPPDGAEAIARYASVAGRGGFVHIVEADSAGKSGALLLELVDPKIHAKQAAGNHGDLSK